MGSVRLREYDNSWYKPGRSVAWRAAWMLVGAPIVRSAWMPSSGLRVRVLRAFGAKIGRGVVIKPAVEVKYPWHLVVGDDCWIGEGAWIDNLTTVRLGNDCCISQGAYLCTGNHDWSDPRFGLIVSGIAMGDGAWAGARSILTPGCVLGEGAVAAAGSVVGGMVPEFAVYAGNPAAFVRKRVIVARQGLRASKRVGAENETSGRGYCSEVQTGAM